MHNNANAYGTDKSDSSQQNQRTYPEQAQQHNKPWLAWSVSDGTTR
jgi:hypothetical protein